MSYLLLNYPIQQVIILGDLFHSTYNVEWNNFLEFLDHFGDITFYLVLGNHDILSSEKYIADNLTCHSTLDMAPFHFTHEPTKHSELYNLCGHIHPCIKMKGRGLQRLRLPCYHFGIKSGVLPAFGAFTGGYNITPDKDDDVYAITANAVLKVL